MSVLSTLCCLSTVSAAENEHGNKVTVAVTQSPYFFNIDEDGEMSGYAYEYLCEIQKYTGWKYEFREMSFDEANNALDDGTVDIVAGNLYSEERAEKWDYSENSMIDESTVLCVMSDDNKYSYNDFENYNGMRIAVIKGSIRVKETEELFKEAGTKAQFVYYDTHQQSKDALQNGEVDAILMSSIRSENAYKIIARIQNSELYICTNKKKPYLKTALDDATEQIHFEHPYYEEELNNKYYGDILAMVAFTREELSYIKKSGTLNVALFENSAPIEYFGNDSLYNGIIFDFCERISRYSGLKFNYMTRNRAYSSKSSSGENVQLSGFIPKSELYSALNNMTVSSTIFSTTYSVVTKNENNISSDKTIAVCLDMSYCKQFALDRGYTKISYFNSYTECLDAVMNGNAELTLMPTYCAANYLRHVYYSDLKTYTWPETYTDFGIGICNDTNGDDYKILCSIINKSIDNIPSHERSAIISENLVSVNEDESLRDYVAANGTFLSIIAVAFVVMLAIFIFIYAVGVRKQNALIKHETEIKSDFYAKMSHDMRTPMNGILGIASLSESENDVETLKNNMLKIKDTGNYMLNLINDTLDVQRIEKGKLALHYEYIDGVEFFSGLIGMLSETAKSKGVSFEFINNTNDMVSYVEIDTVRLKQVFVNLISNAIKFTPKGGKVELILDGLGHENGVYHDKFTVRDNGVGMSADFIENHLYEPFAQEHNDLTAKYAGSGLGLSIVKKLVDLMDGRIEVESEQGKGTEFTLYLDIKSVDEKTAKKAEAKKNEKKVQNIDILKNKRILLCEDNQLNADIAKKQLEKAGCITEHAENGQIGRDMFKNSEINYYDAVLMDIHMPVMNGLDATREIRKADRADAQTIPIIAMSANAFAEDIKKSLDAGMNFHLAKPVSPQKLYGTLAEYIINNELN